MKLKTSLWVLVLAFVVSAGVLFAVSENQSHGHVRFRMNKSWFIDTGHGIFEGASTYPYSDPLEVQGGDGHELLSTSPKYWKPGTGLFLGRYVVWIRMPLYGVLLVAGLPILAAVNVGFSLYRRKLGSPSKAAGA